MTHQGGSLRSVATAELRRLRAAIASGRLLPPFERFALVANGVSTELEVLAHGLSAHSASAALLLLDCVLAERNAPRPELQLVWTGPEGMAAQARDTAVVVRELFERAEQSVLLAGYTFDHGLELLAPLHAAMRDRGVAVQLVIDIKQRTLGTDPDQWLAEQMSAFWQQNWPATALRPRVYYDPRSRKPGKPWVTMHAKCAVIDGRSSFISSANFTERGQERNIEAGVLIEDRAFAESLTKQWQSLIQSGLLREYLGVA